MKALWNRVSMPLVLSLVLASGQALASKQEGAERAPPRAVEAAQPNMEFGLAKVDDAPAQAAPGESPNRARKQDMARRMLWIMLTYR